MANPRYGSDKAVMFIAGDDAAAKNRVTQLSNELGFETIVTARHDSESIKG